MVRYRWQLREKEKGALAFPLHRYPSPLPPFPFPLSLSAFPFPLSRSLASCKTSTRSHAPKASLEARYAKCRFLFFASERGRRCAACRDVRGGSDVFLTAQCVVRLVGRRAFCVPLPRTRHPEIGSMDLAGRGPPSGPDLHIAAFARTRRIRARVGGASWCSGLAPSCARAERCCIPARVSSRGLSAPGRDCRAPVAQRTVPSPSSPGLLQQPQLSRGSRTLSGTNCFG
jgi:hypothetical protein